MPLSFWFSLLAPIIVNGVILGCLVPLVGSWIERKIETAVRTHDVDENAHPRSIDVKDIKAKLEEHLSILNEIRSSVQIIQTTCAMANCDPKKKGGA